ncbi:MAG: GntR family transcriptional regulator [Pararhodobacter sp.]|nr:GntR family transcriptional regulator [Pararhodobacter sp.]
MTMAMNRPASSSPDGLVRDILHGLSDGRYVPGQRLVEPDLMQAYHVGRSTVREALGRLAAGGVVEQMPHRGARIRRLDRRAARDLLRVTEALLGLAAREAGEAVAAGADPARFDSAARVLATAEPDTEARARARYYRELVALGGNGELQRLLPALQIHLIRAQLRPLRHEEAASAERAGLVQAILAGQGAEAEARARAHVARLTAALPALPDTAFAAG